MCNVLEPTVVELNGLRLFLAFTCFGFATFLLVFRIDSDLSTESNTRLVEEYSNRTGFSFFSSLIHGGLKSLPLGGGELLRLVFLVPKSDSST